ncbi:ParB N-terminal domain-containing protein [Micromonospora yangpuensis]|uniref:ParB N-terminal domain-containing protein n=1 Tax=Micromonospora yangpuensis TaxID=683228 RepID=UPI001112FD49|nr:ParB N-terminal domain-containing protein [Micromonospora yangpuensis]
MPPRTARVPIASVVAGETPRLDGISAEHVHLLATAAGPLPPVLVQRTTMRVVDGLHRLHAAIAAGHDTIEVEFFDGPERTAFVEAVRANISHGLPLTLADRRAAAERIVRLCPQWSDRMVAAVVGLSDKTVAKVRRGAATDVPPPDTRIGRDGRARPVNSTAGRWIASELIEQRPQASLREIAREAGISVSTVRDVRQRMSRGDAPVPALSAAVADPPVAVGPPVAPDGSSLLEGLKRDPSLRYNEVGRELLRWLELRTIRTTELGGIAERVPPHAAVIVAGVARRCAAVWENLAQELELRTDAPAEATRPPVRPGCRS